MRKKIFIISIISISIVAGTLIYLIKPKFNSDFANEILVKYKHNNLNINKNIVNESDINALKDILKGKMYTYIPSCGFSKDISITLSNGHKTIILCPALDGCPIIRIEDTNKYFTISGNDRQVLDDILEKYGFEFPSL